MTEPLHVANGHCTTRLIEAAGLPGRTQIWADALHDGPVPDVPDDQLVRVRARFIASDLDVAPEAVEADLRHWRAVVDDHAGYSELVLWFEHDLFDQLNLIQLLSRVGRDRAVPKPISLISIDSYPGHPQFKGLGELTPADVAALFKTRTRITQEQFALGAAAWDAFRAQDRARLEAFLRRDTTALPFLAAALQRYLDEAPGRDGLTRSERRLLEQLSRGPLDIHAAWAGMHDGERAYYITDSSFWTLVQRLAARSPALITVASATGQHHPGRISTAAEGHPVARAMNDRDRALLTELRHLLLHLHKTLIDWQRAEYELDDGAMQPMQLLQVIFNDERLRGCDDVRADRADRRSARRQAAGGAGRRAAHHAGARAGVTAGRQCLRDAVSRGTPGAARSRAGASRPGDAVEASQSPGECVTRTRRVRSAFRRSSMPDPARSFP